MPLALRAAPRRNLEYRLLLSTDAARIQLENRLISWQARVYGLPIWMDATASPNAIPDGSVSLSVATAHRDFVAGGIVGLVHGLDAEFAQVTAVTLAAIALNDPIAADWPAGTKIVPARSPRVQDDLRLSWLTDAITLARPQFRLEDEWPIPPVTEPETYRGHPMLLTPPNWREDVEGEFGRKWRELDFLTGRRVIDDLTGITTQTRSHRWLLVGRTEIATFRAWLAARAGKLKVFWLPSFQSDMQVDAPVGGIDTFLTADNRGYAEGPGSVVDCCDLLITTPARTLTVNRGVLDTVPTAHEAGSRIWFADGAQGVDPTEYAAGETVDARLLTVTGKGTLALASAPTDSLAMNRRQNRPYPPDNVTIDNVAYPAVAKGDLVISWAHWDRLSQAVSPVP